ncbi:mannose-1-phosphate guanylyltransferase / phosphomannomutase [Natronincola peptidivorans]|uniref:Mannose-1-phosphate guanylyltransferase / phosphomannomutase n=1 Tax=Natronincola peptidivorans TaxID=426128 RepID=A0A1I0DYC4_9FIRM|nr:sugar phosphate nucleotidyltransferase [Natronincola peptidivorans]SET37446.1 mannose-1-phosphate guanylyltransferase / phosphomannomutase [Natronincola peptidivorans]
MIHIKAIIMAGGKGTRLKPLTCSIPKPMVPILNKPTMAYTVELLKKHAIQQIAVTIAHLPTVITDYFGAGEKWGINLQYYVEEVPLGTGGSVKNAAEFIDDTFIVLSGDSLTDIDIQKAVNFHRKKQSKATLILKKEAVPIEYGVVITDEDGKITRFLEKPSWGEVFSNTINTGMYILEPEVLHYYQKGENFDFSKDLFPKLLADNIPMYGYITEDYWCDVGALDSYTQTHFDILQGKVNIAIDGYQIEEGIWIGEGTQIRDNVSITPPVYVGRDCILEEGSKLEPYTTIGDHCSIGKNATLKRSVAWNNTSIGRDTHSSGAVICNDVEIKKQVEIYENAVIGEGSTLMDGVIVKPDIKLWPHKKIDENTIVNQNLVWGTKASKTIFGFKDVCGQINIDISPEFASRLGTAFASSLKEPGAIIISSDASNASSIIKNALIAGIHSTGAGVIHIGNVAMPMNRFAVTHFNGNGGIHVRMDDTDKNLVHIEFADKNGANIQRATEREIENLFNREDFRRGNADQIKSTIHIDSFKTFYLDNGTRLLKNIAVIRRKHPKILVSSKSKEMQKLTCEFLEMIGCGVQQDYSIENVSKVEDYLLHMSQQVIMRKVDFGVVIGEDGETMILVDKKGRIIQQEKFDALVVMMLLMEGIKKEIVLPHTYPERIEKIAKEHHVQVRRTKSNPASIMNAMLSMEEREDKGLSQYVLSYNAIWGIGLILDFLIEKNMKLEDLADAIPAYYFIKESIPCDWQDKGWIIRQLAEEHQHNNIELFEGVKIKEDNGWALILPDSEKPLFNLYTEGFSEEYAQELSSAFREKVKALLKSQRK